MNVGLPDIDEVSMMKEVITELQSVTSLPLQIDTVDIQAMEQAMRIYNGKPMVNSVSGKQESMDAVFPLIQKYGGVVIGLTLDLPVDQREEGTMVTTVYGVQKGSAFVRVHDVEKNLRAIKMTKALMRM